MVLAEHALLHSPESHSGIPNCGLDFQPDHPSSFLYTRIPDDLSQEPLSTLDLYRYPDNLEHYVLTRKSKSRHRPVPRARFQSPA